MKFVPEEQRNQNSPCRFIPLTEKGETIEHLYRYGTQIELKEALKRWLRGEISRIEAQFLAAAEQTSTA